jgi:beta-catenin-like protein 1
VSLLQEMIDVGNMEEAGEELTSLLDAFQAQHGLELIVQKLLRLNEFSSDEDAQGVHNTLNILESLMEVDSHQYSILILQKTSLLSYLLKRILHKVYDSNKLYCTEILSMMIQSASAPVALAFTPQPPPGGEDYLEQLLQSIAYYKKKDLKLTEEQECLENLFLALCSLLMYPSIQARFLQLEGIELLLRCLQSQEYAAFCSLSALSYAILQHYGGCVKLLDCSGLKYVFAYLMLVSSQQSSNRHKHRKIIMQKAAYLRGKLDIGHCSALPPVWRGPELRLHQALGHEADGARPWQAHHPLPII